VTYPRDLLVEFSEFDAFDEGCPFGWGEGECRSRAVSSRMSYRHPTLRRTKRDQGPDDMRRW
jgi:hypothetical protein